MFRRIISLIILSIFLTGFTSNIAYAQKPIITQPYGPKISDLQNKEDIINSLNQIKIIRRNLTIINIKPTTPTPELKDLYVELERYIEQLRIIRVNLVRHSDTYKDSIPDVFFSEQIVAIADCYIISLKHQQLLVNAIENNVAEISTLFFSSYLIPIYYYITQGDQLVAYTETYITVT